jgi:hypothetical protein
MATKAAATLGAVTMVELLESTPPGTEVTVKDLATPKPSVGTSPLPCISHPDIQLHCDSKVCGGVRTFTSSSDDCAVVFDKPNIYFLTYLCRNCRIKTKTYTFTAIAKAGSSSGRAHKLGELPPFGSRMPSRLTSLVSKDWELFLQGRMAESRGFGIRAFAYYRQVVEHEKGRIIKEIGKVAEKLGADESIVAKLRAAAAEDQFSKAIGEVRDVIPASLLIHGQNPLILLHKALSEGLHEDDDAECLERAQSIRLVLTELADRISQNLKDTEELKQAVAKQHG